MVRILFIIAFMLGLVATSCIEDDFTGDSSDVLAFSVDTLSFDTVFTGEGTPTRRFVIYNRHKKQLRIERISLSGMPEGAKFFLNVDGRSGEEFHDVEVRGEDSIYVFVEAHIDAGKEGMPFDVFGNLNFVTNGVQQKVVLRAAGQNARKVTDWHITKDTVLPTDLPCRVMDSIVVEQGATLTIPAGTTVYFHDKARLLVRGRLRLAGEAGKPVTLRGDRLDRVVGNIPFDQMSGQWSGVQLAPESFGNTFDYVNMRSSSIGLTVDSCGVFDKEKARLFNSVFHNSSGSTLKAAYSWITAIGCEFSDAKDAVVGLTGGKYKFSNCTFANYYLFDVANSAILTLDNVLPEGEASTTAPQMSAEFDNCIIYGNATDVSPGDLAGSSVYLRNCLLKSKGTNDDNFIDCIWEGNPKFYTVREDYLFDYRLKDGSDAIGKGNAALCPQEAHYDYYGNDRFATEGILDIGAYVWVPEPEEKPEQ